MKNMTASEVRLLSSFNSCPLRRGMTALWANFNTDVFQIECQSNRIPAAMPPFNRFTPSVPSKYNFTCFAGLRISKFRGGGMMLRKVGFLHTLPQVLWISTTSDHWFD